MGVLAEYVRREAEHLKQAEQQREAALNEWLAAVKELYERLRGWLDDADAGLGLLKHGSAPAEPTHEPRLGRYNAPRYFVSLGGLTTDRTVFISPRARFVIATIKPPGGAPRRADGTLELKCGSAAEWYLFRLRDTDGDRWFIQSVARWNADPDDRAVDQLDRDRFESVILSLLK